MNSSMALEITNRERQSDGRAARLLRTVFGYAGKVMRGPSFPLDVGSWTAYLPLVSIGTAIRAAREARGWSQPDLASRVKAARETISRWETGDLQPTERTLVALEAILGPLEVKEESKPNPKRRRKS